MVDQPSLLDALPDLLPTAPGCITGIVSRAPGPFVVQCPTCGDCYTGRVAVLAAQSAPFRGRPPRRQCLDCWAEDGHAWRDYEYVEGDPAAARAMLDRALPSRHKYRISPAQARALIATGGA